MTALRLRSALSAGLILLTSAGWSRTITVQPTSTPRDYGLIKERLGSLDPGDTLVLAGGVFDWSANVTDTSTGIPGGMPVFSDRVTIRGTSSTVLKGAVDNRGQPVRLKRGTNAAFKNGPGVHHVTIRALTFEDFENAIVLLQSDSLSWASPAGAYREGTRGWTLDDLSIRGGAFGIAANGRHVDLTVRRCRFRMKPGDGRDQDGSFAIGIRPFPPAYGGLPERVVIEDNAVSGPERPSAQKSYAGIIVTADQSVIRRNLVESYGLGMVLEGRAIEVSDNRLNRCGLGLVAWTTGRLGTETKAARIQRNEIRSMTRRGSGFLAGFTGSGMLLAGVSDSRISDNIFSANAGADIVFGSVRTTPPSVGNTVAGNGGVVLISRQSLEKNTIDGSRTMVRDLAPPGEEEN